MKSEKTKTDMKKICNVDLLKLSEEMKVKITDLAMKISSKREKNFSKLRYLKRDRARVLGELSQRKTNE
jgi:ribosomal protein L29